MSATTYCLGLIVEEMGETLCHIGRALRFGVDTLGQDGLSERAGLERELGDVLAALEFATKHGVISRDGAGNRARAKLHKLLDPASLDNLGRPLAPQPPLERAA